MPKYWVCLILYHAIIAFKRGFYPHTSSLPQSAALPLRIMIARKGFQSLFPAISTRSKVHKLCSQNVMFLKLPQLSVTFTLLCRNYSEETTQGRNREKKVIIFYSSSQHSHVLEVTVFSKAPPNREDFPKHFIEKQTHSTLLCVHLLLYSTSSFRQHKL